jgi:hypothetical protein
MLPFRLCGAVKGNVADVKSTLHGGGFKVGAVHGDAELELATAAIDAAMQRV